MTDMPDGVVTFLLTDIEGSTKLWEDAPEAMMTALRQHDDVIDQVVLAHNGVSVKPRGEGDSRFLVFTSAHAAVAAAADIQQRFAAIHWATPRPIQIRACLHTGSAELQLGDYYGSVVNRAARIRGIAHGGQTVLSRATWELVQDQLPPGASVRDMGEHGLKDLTRPEHIYQLEVEGLSAEFPPLESLDAVPNNLPVQLTEFVGRQSELSEVKGLLDGSRLVTILAPGGTGKTRLAIQAAADLVADYPDGVFFIALADISSPDDILQATSEAMGLGLSADEDMQTQFLNYLANKSQLLVFDNFEHVARGSSLIAEILRAASHVTVIATSRSKLGVTGETVYSLGGLDITWENDDQALQTSGVVLFLEAARRVKPEFQLAKADLTSVAQILQLTGGNPLAIQLAAAWANMLSVRDIADEIAKSLDFLESDDGDVPDRHRSVRAVFEYSWALLSEDERKVFSMLSVFRGGFDRSAAEAVAGASLRSLANLVTKALVTPSPETGRYLVHELLRQYADAELRQDTDLSAKVDAGHAEFYASLAGDALDLLLQADQPRMLQIIEEDLENIRAAWRHYQASNSAPPGRHLLRALYFIYEWRGWYRSAATIFGEAAEAFTADDDSTTIARWMAQAAQGWFVVLLGNAQEGMRLAGEAYESLPRTADPMDRWIALQCSVLGLAYAGALDEATTQLKDSLPLGGDVFLDIGLKNWMGFLAAMSGDFDNATGLLDEAMEVLEQRDDHYYMTWNLWLQSMVATQQGRVADAIELSGRQVARAREIRYLRGLVVGYDGLGDANLAAGNAQAAEDAFVRSLATAEQMGMVIDMLGTLPKIAATFVSQDRIVDAVELLSSVLAEPMSAGQPFSSNVPIKEVAEKSLASLEGTLAGDEYADAIASGRAKPWDVAAKELITARR